MHKKVNSNPPYLGGVFYIKFFKKSFLSNSLEIFFVSFSLPIVFLYSRKRLRIRLLTAGLFDGILRPLNVIAEIAAAQGLNAEYIARGLTAPSLDRDIKWEFKPSLKKGDKVQAGDILGTVQETELINHKILVPFGVEGEITEIKAGAFTVTETVAKIADTEVKLMHKWPVRTPRPYKNKQIPTKTNGQAN